MTGRGLAVAAALVLLLAACGGPEQAPDSGARPTADGEGAADVASESEDATSVRPPGPGPVEAELVDAGDQPHMALRLAPDVGDVAHLRVTSDQQGARGSQPPARPGPPPVTLALEVVEVDEERIEAAVTIEEVASDDEQLVTYLMAVEGTLELDDRGRIHDVSSSVDPEVGGGPPDLDPDELSDGEPEPVDDATFAQLQTFETLHRLPIFPQEPVGVGAVWRVEQPSMLLAPHREVTTVTLEELDAEGGYRLRTEATYELLQEYFDWLQETEQPEGAAPPETVEIDGEGTGEIEGELGDVVPNRAERSLEITTRAESPEGEPVEQTMRINDRLERD